MNKIELIIGQCMRIGVIISILLVLTGGILYLSEQGHQLLQQGAFYSEPSAFKSIVAITCYACHLTSLGLIQLGIAVLVLTQVIRVALTTLYFMWIRDYIFTFISLAILCVLFGSLFWHQLTL